MARILIVCFVIFPRFILFAQSQFKREPELFHYMDAHQISYEKNGVLLFIQNLVCKQGCDPYVSQKINSVISRFPGVRFTIIHTLPGDTLFAEKSTLAGMPDVTVFCDDTGDFQRKGLDFYQHKIFVIVDKKLLWWNHFDSSTLKNVLKNLKKYHRRGLI